MHKFAYILPVITIGAVLLLFKNYELWWLYLIMIAVSEWLLWLLIHRVSRTKEFLSGYAICVQHHEAWVERVERRVSYTDSRGNTHWRTKVDYRRHPDEWWMILNTGQTTLISSERYYQICRLWNTPGQWINPYHHNCVSGGGGQQHDWNDIYEDSVTQTYKGLYVNYVVNSNSIFRKNAVSEEEAEESGLIDYPHLGLHDLECDVILASPLLPDGIGFSKKSQRLFQLINAHAGFTHEIHVFILVFDASQDITTALKQQAYWHGGNKNEFVVCLGVNVSQIDTQKPMSENPTSRVEWCKAFSWCDVPRLESATESWFLAHRELDFTAYADWLRGNLGLWKRKEFSDFKYLGIRLTPWRNVLVYFISLILCGAIAICSVLAAIGYRENYKYDRTFDGYGYELVDKYFPQEPQPDPYKYPYYY